MFMLSGTEVHVEETEEDSTADTIYKRLDSNFSVIVPFVEETVDRWNSRSQLLKSTGHKSAQ